MFNFFKKKKRSKFIFDIEKAAVKRAVYAVVENGTHYASAGHPNVGKFEKKLSEFFNGAPALGVNSGTDALVLALKAIGTGPGDEIIAPAFSYISTASCISWIGANPVFVDVSFADFAIDPSKVEEKITKKTKAVIVAHLFGQPASGLEKIIGIAKKHSLFIIEDAAQSFGAEVEVDGKWKRAGTVGDIGCLSFSSTKPFAGPGNGGAIIFNAGGRSLIEKADQMRFYGAKTHYYDYPAVGVCAKLQEIQAAALIAKMPFLNYWLKKRKEIADYYTKELSGIKNIALPKEEEGTRRIWYRYVIRAQKRDDLFNCLKNAAGGDWQLQPAKNYPVPLPYFSAFKELGCAPGDFPAAEQLSSEVISLPLVNAVSEEDAEKICDRIKSFYS